MATKSKIEWTDATWNPVTGCTRVSDGCDHCYAVKQTYRMEMMGQTAKYGGLTVLNGKGERHFNGVVKCHDDVLQIPLRRRKPTTYFVNSMSDLFHKNVPFEFVDKVFGVMAMCPQHTFQVLTKRSERMAEWCEFRTESGGVAFFDGLLSWEAATDAQIERQRKGFIWPLPNVWLGTSVENQATADERIPHLLRCPAAVGFLSMEPLLGGVVLHKHFAQCECGHGHGFTACPNTGGVAKTCHRCACRELRPLLSWVIGGGESGPGARICDVDWVRNILRQCQAAGVPCFIKQLGENVRADEPEGVVKIRLSKKGGLMDEWPEDLRVREMPMVKPRKKRKDLNDNSWN